VRAGAGVASIVSGSGLALLVAFGLWRRLPSAVLFVSLATCGALVGVGALLVQDRPGPWDWAIAPVVLGVLTPIHARLVLGRPGASG